MGDLFQQLKNSKRLPSPPGVAFRVLELAQNEETELGDIAAVVSSDPALSAKILRFVNSPVVGIDQPVTSLHKAIALMGLRAVKLMALSFSLVSTEEKTACPGFEFDRFWSRSLACAVAGRTIARQSKVCNAEDAFVCGLLGSIGQLAMASGISGEYARVLEQAAESGRPLRDVEASCLGTTHRELGVQLLQHWKLPEQLWQGVAQVHALSADAPPGRIEPLSRVLHTAELTAAVLCGREGSREQEAAALAAAARDWFDWDPPRWEAVFDEITTHWRECAEILSVPAEDPKSFAEIRGEAQERIAELSLAAQMEVRRAEEEHDELLKRATTDPLTGIGNRAAFDERLELEVNRAERTGQPLALVMMDIDRFKRFNDTHGHQAGDAVLRAVAAAAADAVRKVDFLARYGGEEFAAVAPECDTAGAAVLGERIRRAVADTLVRFENRELRVTVSVGAAVYAHPDRSRAPGDLIRAADRLLYRAKDAGRNNVKVAAFRQSAGVPAAVS